MTLSQSPPSPHVPLVWPRRRGRGPAI
jgi:hypothetical protein